MIAYKGYMKAQRRLALKNIDFKVLNLASRRLPQLNEMFVALENFNIGAEDLDANLPILRGNELSFDGAHTLLLLF